MLEAWVVWLVLALAVVALELVAVFSKRRGDTISESVWWLLRRGAGVALLPFYIWIGWHFFLEFWGFPQLRGTFVDDVVIVAVAALLTGIGQLLLGQRR